MMKVRLSGLTASTGAAVAGTGAADGGTASDEHAMKGKTVDSKMSAAAKSFLYSAITSPLTICLL
jgi:hypothetical protein